MEQGQAELLLERLDLMAHCALGHRELVGGAGEAKVAGRRLKGAQRIERRQATLHVRTHEKI